MPHKSWRQCSCHVFKCSETLSTFDQKTKQKKPHNKQKTGIRWMLLCTKQAHSSSAPADATWYQFHPSFSTVPRPSSTGTPSRSSNWRTPFYKGLANIQTEANLSRASWQQNNNLPVVADTLKSPVPNHNKLYPPIFLSILGAKWPERLKFQWLETWIA